MQIRLAKPTDFVQLPDVDGTIESSRYLHLDQSGEGLAVSWRLEERPLREKQIEPNRLTDETTFLVKQIVTGADEGTVLVAEYDEALVAVLVAHHQPQRNTLQIVDLRVDYETRRQGIGTAMVYQAIAAARELERRAVSAETTTNNFAAIQLLHKLGFELSGVDTRRHSNHDVVKESATLFWYLPLSQ